MKKKKRIVRKKKETVIEKKEFNYIPLGKCRSCKKIVKDTDFNDNAEAMKKFASSGLCTRCIDIELDEDIVTTTEDD